MKNLYSKSLSKKKVIIVFASLLVFAFLSVFYEGSKKTVAITLNGKKEVVRTHADTILDFLEEQNVSVHSKDYVFPKSSAKIQNNMNIVWKEARQVQIVKDSEKKTVWTTAETVAELLREQKIVFNRHDQISPKPEKSIKEKMRVYMKSSHHLTLIDGGNQKQVWSTSTTVADFLKQQGIKLNDLDRVEPSQKETVKENGTINVIRVEKVTDVVEEPIQFAVVTQQDANMDQGKEVTIAEGEQGLTSKQFEVILENGKEVTRNLISETRIKEKKDKVVAVGAKNLAFQVSRGEVSGGQEFYVGATAYTANCNGCSGHTATGLNLNVNPNAKVIAVDPRIIPLGSKVYVEGYGYAVAADTGGAIKGYRIDVFFSSKADAYRWGNRKVKITVLN
jgi:uncharacterized protein YabE (DUF348 family)